MNVTAPLVRAPGFVIVSRCSAYLSLLVALMLAATAAGDRLRVTKLETTLAERGLAMSSYDERFERLELAIGPQLRDRLGRIHRRLDLVEGRLSAACPAPILPLARPPM